MEYIRLLLISNRFPVVEADEGHFFIDFQQYYKWSSGLEQNIYFFTQT